MNTKTSTPADPSAFENHVERTLSSLTLEEKIGQLMCPSLGDKSGDDLKALLEKVPLGCAFFSDWEIESTREHIRILQESSRVPVLIAGDMESGPAFGTCFPNAMGCSAAGAENRMYERGRITAREAKAAGFNWSFAPCVDIGMNFRNVETGLRAWGDTAEQVKRMVVPLIQGMQDGGLAATAKHFPGTGMDDRDQHLCTAVNSLSVEEWKATYGEVWKACFEAGVMSVMPGHISLPDWEGLRDRPSEAMPATLNAALQRDLLRGELGYDGLLVSDAGVMIGCASRIRNEEMMVRNLQSGGDVFLFPEIERDFQAVLRAVESGELSMDLIDASVRRVLTMKHRLGLHEEGPAPVPTAAENHAARQLSREISEAGVTVLRNDGSLPVQLKEGARVLTVTIKNNTDVREAHRCPPLEVVDEELRRRGFTVEHWDTPESGDLKKAVEDYDWIFINLHNPMHSMIGNIRLIHRMAMAFWEGWWVGHPRVTWTSFANPFHLYEFPHWPNMVLTWGHHEENQRAAVKVWLGEMEARGRCPVAMPIEAGPCEAPVR